MEDYTTLLGIYERITFQQQISGITNRQLADAMGITAEQLSNLIELITSDLPTARGILCVDNIIKISKSLSTSVEYLLTGRNISAYRVNMDRNYYADCLQDPTREDDTALYDRLYDLEEEGLFADMLFEPGSITSDLTAIQEKVGDGNWNSSYIERPRELEDFSFAWFQVKAQDVPGYGGVFNEQEQLLCIPKDSIDDDKVVLHEMIHIYEYVINSLPLFYHDVLYWALYSNLREEKRVKKLDAIINNTSHLLEMNDIYNKGGLHDTLFFLKSIDLDIRRGYPLGTVFSYGRADVLKSIME